MKIIDVDSHFYEPVDWLEQTDPKLAAEIPKIDIVTLMTTSIAGDLLASLPPELRPDPMSLLPDRLRPLAEKYRDAPMTEVAKVLRDLHLWTHAAWTRSLFCRHSAFVQLQP
jgi:hypothetical protein